MGSGKNSKQRNDKRAAANRWAVKRYHTREQALRGVRKGLIITEEKVYISPVEHKATIVTDDNHSRVVVKQLKSIIQIS